MQRRLLVILLLGLLLSVACNAKLVMPTASPLSPLTSPLLTATSQPTTVPTLKAMLSPTPWPTLAATALPTLAPTPVGIAPPPGLIYKVGKELWRIDDDGKAIQLLEHSFDYLSADGTSAIDLKGSPFWDEMWLIDLTTGAQRNLTEGLGRSPCCVTWWPKRSNTILFGSWPLQNVGRDSGYLSIIQVDGSGYEILDEKNTFEGLPALSPDGRTIAYSAGPTGMIYQWGKGPSPFNPETFGVSVNYLRSPAWSPDGKKIAWVAIKDAQFCFGIFDLVKHTAELFHPYPPTAAGTLTPIWSPNGRWLALSIINDDTMKQELWVVPVDTLHEEHFLLDDLYPVYPVWSPESQSLISQNVLYEAGTWRAQPLALPVDAEVVAWVSPTK